jgi:hypothetical protein
VFVKLVNEESGAEYHFGDYSCVKIDDMELHLDDVHIGHLDNGGIYIYADKELIEGILVIE